MTAPKRPEDPAAAPPPPRRPTSKDRATRSSSHAKRDALAQAEDKLTELLSGAALMQMTAATLTDDPRHVIGGQVTADFAPKLAAAWVALGRRNPAVGRVLIRLAEGSEVGEVAAVTVMFAFTQGQVYGLVPAHLPNPWMPSPPPSDEVQSHTHANGRPPPPQGTAAPGSDDASATERAEAQRHSAEARRKRVHDAEARRGRSSG